MALEPVGLVHRVQESSVSEATVIPLADQLAEVRREIGMRRKAYPRWVSLGRMKQEQADRGIAAMEAARDTLARLVTEQSARDTPTLF